MPSFYQIARVSHRLNCPVVKIFFFQIEINEMIKNLIGGDIPNDLHDQHVLKLMGNLRGYHRNFEHLLVHYYVRLRYLLLY